MKQTELVIKIPKYVYDMIFDADRVIDADSEIVANAIKNGTPLPKGHGRIGDFDIAEGWLEDGYMLDDVPALLEADKEGEQSNGVN